MKRVVVFFFTLSALLFVSCSNTPKITMNVHRTSEPLEYDEKGDTLIVSERNGCLCINQLHRIACTHRRFVPVMNQSGDTLFVADTTDIFCFCLSEFKTKYKIRHLPYGKYVLIFGFRNMEDFQQMKEEFPDFEMVFPATQIDFQPDMQQIVIPEQIGKDEYNDVL